MLEIRILILHRLRTVYNGKIARQGPEAHLIEHDQMLKRLKDDYLLRILEIPIEAGKIRAGHQVGIL